MRKSLRTTVSRLGAALGLLAGIAAPTPAADKTPLLSIAQGRLRGDIEGASDRFLGIPYAAPPIGQLRWSPPAAPASWTGVRDATRLASKCVQNGWTNPVVEYRNEDCLYLNVYRPHAATSERPVIIWFHGGAFVAGSAQDVDGSVLAARADAVVVTVNYRLGVFGFLSLPELSAESREHVSGNYALLDQQAAMRWVHANIARFGGDPAQVTLMGQSAGGITILDHLDSPGAHGLFARAIVMSAPSGFESPIADEQTKGPSSKVASRLGCADKPDLLACLRAAPAARVYEAGGGAKTRSAGWSPVVDGIVVPHATGSFDGTNSRVPVLIGSVAREGGFWAQARRYAGVPTWGAADYATYLKRFPHPDAIAAQYPLARAGSADLAYAVIVGDLIACGVAHFAEGAAARGQATSVYEFAEADAPTTIFDVSDPVRGPFHNSDIPFFFGKGYPGEQKPDVAFSPAQQALSIRMIGDVRAFVHGQKPDGERWPGDKALILAASGDRTIAMRDYGERHSCGFWASEAPKGLPL